MVLATPGFVHPDTIELFNRPNKTSILIKIPKGQFVKAVSFHDNDTRSAKLWDFNTYSAESWTIDTQTGTVLSKKTIENDEYYTCKKLSADQKHYIRYSKIIIELFNKKKKIMALNTAHDDNSLYMFDFQVREGNLLSAIISPDNKLIATETSDKITVWSIPLSQRSIRNLTKKQLAFIACFIKMHGNIPVKDVPFYSRLPESIKKKLACVQWQKDELDL